MKTNKLLSVVLTLCVLLAAFSLTALAAEGDVAKIGDVGYATLAEAIAAAKDGETVTLTADTTEDVTIDKNITLDLGTKTLTNAGAGKATLTVAKGATATVKNGSIVGGASYYTIQNNGTATFEELTATAGNTGSSMLDNWGDLTINSGTYIGGLDTVKSEEDSKLTITGGKFVSDYAPKYNVTGTILVYGETAITGGEFVQNSTSTAARVVVTGVVEGHTPSLTKVSGGKFTTKSGGAIFHWMGKATPDNFEVSGGSYSKSVSELVCADGFIPTKNADGTYGVKVGKYVAKIGSKKYETLADAVRLAAKGKTVTLIDDLDISTTGLTVAATKTVTLDLNGHALKAANTNTGNIKVLGKLTLCDSTDTEKNGTGTGKVWTDTPYIYNKQDKVLIAAMDGGTFTMESGLIDTASSIADNANDGQFAVSVQNENADATVIINGGHIKAGWYAVAGNGTDITYNGNITVNGGILESVADYAIYHPHTGTTTVNGGVIFGAAGGISLNRGKLIVNDGTITSKGTGTTGNWGDGTGNQQAAAINVNAKYETTAVEIKGGKITAEKDAILLTNGRNGTVAVSGGSFSSEIKPEYCAEGFVPAANADGTYGVKVAPVAKIGTVEYATLAEAIAAAKDGDTVTLTADTTEDVTIDKNITLDLGTKMLTNTGAGKATLTVAAGATAVVENGSIVGGASYYNIAVGTAVNSTANLTLENVTATAGNTVSSMIDNWGTLTITSGTYTGGLNVVKSEEGSTLNISGGKFELNYAVSGKYTGVILSAGTTTISGGEFTQNATTPQWGYPQVVLAMKADGYTSKIEIKGGIFTNNKSNGKIFHGTGKATSDNFEVSGGTFNKSISDGYCADGFIPTKNADGTYGVKVAPVAKIGTVEYATLAEAIAAAKDGDTVTLTADINTPETSYYIQKSLTIDLGGKTLTGSGYDGVFNIEGENAAVLIKNGKIVAVEQTGTAGKYTMAVWACAAGCEVTLEDLDVSQQITHTDDKQMDMIYTSKGTIIINSGRFESGTSAWTLNCKDSAYKAGTAKIIVNGGTFVGYDPRNNTAEGAGTSFVAPGVGVDAVDGSFTAKAGMTAQVMDAKGASVKAFATLAEAIAAAAKGSTVTLLADTRENVTIDKALTLDLNGFTLNGGTVKAKPALTITARTVTIKDSSEAQTGTIMREDTAENSGVSSHYVIDIQGNAWVMFESGKVTNNSGTTAGKGASLVRVGDDSVAKYPGLVIKGGTFTQDNFVVIKVDRGYLTLKGGTLNSTDSYAIENWFSATIKGGTVNGTVAAWTYSDGSNSTLTVEDGTINGDVESVSYDGSTGKKASVSITGGTVNGTLSTKIYGEATTPGKDVATIEVTGGTFANDPTKYVVEGATVTKNSEGKFGVEKAYLAKVGNTSYYTMEEAFKAQTASGEPVVLLRDYTTRGTFNSGSSNRTVDLNGYTWTYTGTNVNDAAFEINYPDVTLTVKNGTVVSGSMVGLIPSAMGGTIKYDNSGLVLEGVTATANGNSGIETNGNNTNDTVTLKNSTLNVPNGFGIYFPSSGTLTLDNSTVTAKTMGVQVCAGSLSINEGSAVTVTGDAVPKAEDDGAIQDGAAISVVNRTGYKGLGTVTVSGGKFTAKEGNSAIKAYDWANKTESDFTADKGTVAVSGGTFSSEIKSEYCAEGFEPVANTDGTYGVAEKARVGLSDNMMIIPRGLADGKYTMLILAAIDSLDYAEVGFKVMVYNDGKAVSDETMYSTTTVYTSVKDGAGKVWKPDDSELGDTACKYLFASTMEIDASDKDAFTLDAYVRVVPYATDYDGNVLVKNTFNIPVTYFFN